MSDGAVITTLDIEGEAVEMTPESTCKVDSGGVVDVPAASEIEDAVSSPDSVLLTVPDFGAMTVKQLRSLARQQKLTFDCPISKTRKSQLVAALLSAHQAS